MRQRLRGIHGHQVLPVSTWQACATPPKAARGGSGPAQVELDASLSWGPPAELTTPTAAAMLRAAGTWSLDAPARRFDAEDWWFRARLPDVDLARGDELVLAFDGIATVADVWLDGAHVLESHNMFLRHERVVTTPTLSAGSELVICCRSLDALLAARRPRPRWRAPMIENQQLRWFRTTLLGRTPGWSPPAAVVGPWAGVCLERRRHVAMDDVHLRTAIDGTTGAVDVTCQPRSLGAFEIVGVDLILERDGQEHRTSLQRTRAGSFAGRLSIPDVALWWPHTHGDPALYAARLSIGGGSPEASVTVDLGAVGFREIVQDGDFSLSVNGVPIFCRGACWTPLDVVTMRQGRSAYERALHQARDAGMNMLRVGGTMVYESDDFYDLADELGILLWHDFMFANMDYPEDDAAFAASVAEEARQFLARLEGRPSLAVLCGNSEVEQQAAMFGASRERWSPKLFHETLATIAKEARPDVPYWPSSAHGGAFPHEARRGTTSYYGVGAYLRPLEDARRSEVRFATECLAFANVPADSALSGGPPISRAALLARTPRDLGAGWDFADVRDHYLKVLFGVDPTALRYGDHDRYLELGRAATAEVMAAVFGEWRRADSRCRGGLVWFLRDLWEGAGWGVVGADGTPKSPWWTMRRACAPVAVHLSDEAGNGLYVHLVNDRQERLTGELELSLFRAGELAVGAAKRAVEIAGHGATSIPAASMFEGFLDLSYAYRFGPPACDLVVATLRAGETLVQTFHFPLGLPSTRELDLGLVARASPRADGDFDLALRTRRFAQSLVVDAEGFTADDAWFHLPPGGERSLRLRRASGLAATVLPKGTVRALNGASATKIATPES